MTRGVWRDKGGPLLRVVWSVPLLQDVWSNPFLQDVWSVLLEPCALFSHTLSCARRQTGSLVFAALERPAQHSQHTDPCHATPHCPPAAWLEGTSPCTVFASAHCAATTALSPFPGVDRSSRVWVDHLTRIHTLASDPQPPSAAFLWCLHVLGLALAGTVTQQCDACVC